MHQRTNRFTEYELTNEETIIATSFNDLQRAYIQTLIAQYAQDVLQLSYDPERPLSFAQDQAYARGAMQALEHLLSSPIPHTPEN